MAIKSTLKGVSTSPIGWNTGGRPSQRDIVKNPPRQPGHLGKETWENSRPGKTSIKGSPRRG